MFMTTQIEANNPGNGLWNYGSEGSRFEILSASYQPSLAVESGGNDCALTTAFQNGLNRVLALRGEHSTLDEAVNRAIKISDQMSL